MQLWQQQLMYKQLQQLRRQQQLQQLDEGARQLGPLSQLSSVAKPATGNQLPSALNEMPINDAYNYMSLNNFVGGASNLPSNSQMIIAGNMNWVHPSCSAAMENPANGVIISNDQSQAMRSMGFMPQQIDQSFHSMPVSCPSSVNQYSHLRMSNNCHDLMTKAAVTQAEKTSYPSSTFQTEQQVTTQGCLQDVTLATAQNFRGKHGFGNSPVQVPGNDATLGNFQQLNNLQDNIQLQEYHGRQEHHHSSGNLLEKPVSQLGTSSGVASLDPIEQKLLFGTDDDDKLGLLFGGSLTSGMGEDMHGHPSENDFYGAFPSIHSGSWSALMQEVVQASSSDKGLQEEWSGLSFQKTEQLMVKPLLTNNDNRKQPAALDDGNLKSATFLTSRSFPLFNDTNATPNSTAPRNRHSFKSAYEENNRVLTEAPHVSFKSSSRGSSNKGFCQSENQTQLVEGGLQAQMPSTGGVWAGQTIEQRENSSGDIQSKSQDIGDGWGNQQNLPFANVSIQPVNKLNGWSTSYPMASRSDNISNYHENDDNLWKTGENHINRNSGLQPVKFDIGSHKMQAEDSLAGNFDSVRNPNTLKSNQEMHQQVINARHTVFGQHFALNTRVNSEGDKDEENQNQSSRRPQTWESSVSTAAERLGDTYEKENEHGRVVSGEGYVGNAAKEKSLLTGNGQYPLMSGSQKSSIQSGQHYVESKMLQNSLRSLRKTAEPSCPPNHLLSFQGLSNSVFHGSNGEEQSFVGKSQFAGDIVSNNTMDASKKAAVGAEELQSRNTIAVCTSSSSFDGSTAQYSQNETIAQASNNILELLHKVDQSNNGYSVNASDVRAQAADISVTHPHFDWSSNLRGFGLQLAPPSQRQPLLNYTPISQNSLNDINSWQSDHEAGCQDQEQPNSTSSVQAAPPLDEASKRENWDKISSLSAQKDNTLSVANKHLNSLSATADFPLVGNHLREQQQQLLQQQHISSAKDHLEKLQQQRQQHISNTTIHEVLDQSVNFSFGNQANVNALVKNASLLRHDCHDGTLAGQSVQASLPTLAGRSPTSGVASFTETRIPVGSQFSTGGTDHRKPTFAGFSRITSPGQQLPVVETKPGSQSSISGMPEQVGFSKVLHNVWTNISAQQRQAGVNPLLTPNVFQSIINHGRDTSSRGLPKAGDKINKKESAPPEAGSSSTNSQKGEEYPVQSKSLNLIQTEKLDVARKSRNLSQQEEAVVKPPLDGGSIVPISSLVRLHQQDVKKAKNVQDPALSSQALRDSSSSDIGISGRMSKPSDVQQQKYSLLHQVQSMKASDSDLNKMTGNIPKGAAGSSNESHMNFNKDQRFDHGQNAVFRIPADVKVGVDSQVSFPSDAKMLSFASNDSEERNPSTLTADRHDLQNYMHSVSTSSTENVMGGSERTQISPQMAPSWFERNGSYQNGRMVALFASQRSGKASMQQYFLQKVPARMDDSNVVEQRLDSSQVGSYGQGTLAAKIAPNESTSSLLPSDMMDEDIILRSKKRKSATIDPLPWHKMVTECPQRLQSISMPELDWAQAANRLIEKVDDEAETMDDGMPQSRRRLILTTQLMHQLIPAVPPAMFRGEATSAYESVTFSVAKSALADSCSLVCSSESDSHVLLGNENMNFGELKTSKKARDDFIGRSKKLETDFSRLDKRTSILDVRLECQELERFSIVNRLGKFHGRTHADGIEVSSTSETAHRKTYPQRYITALSVPGNLPEGVLCLSL